MSKNFKAAAVVAPGKLEIREYPYPEVDDRDMLARVIMTGVCGTDVHLVNSPKPFPWLEQAYPFNLGHEWVGRIEKLGKDFYQEDAYGQKLKEGDRIVVFPSTWACGDCYACKILLQPNLCIGTKYKRDFSSKLMAAYGEYFYIPERSTVYKVPEELPNEVAVLTEPMSAALRSFERAFGPGAPDRGQGMGPGKSLVFHGTGAIGTLLVILGKLSGAYPIIAIGGPDERLKLCKELGADIVIDVSKVSGEEKMKIIKDSTIHGLGADVVMEAAGVPAAFIDGINMVRTGGTMVELGHYTDRGTVAINPQDICKKDIHLFGSWGQTGAEFGAGLRILAAFNGKVPFSKLVTHSFPLEKLPQAIETAKEWSCMKAVIEF